MVIKIGKKCSLIKVHGISECYKIVPNNSKETGYTTDNYSIALFQFKEYELNNAFEYHRI